MRTDPLRRTRVFVRLGSLRLALAHVSALRGTLRSFCTLEAGGALLGLGDCT